MKDASGVFRVITVFQHIQQWDNKIPQGTPSLNEQTCNVNRLFSEGYREGSTPIMIFHIHVCPVVKEEIGDWLVV